MSRMALWTIEMAPAYSMQHGSSPLTYACLPCSWAIDWRVNATSPVQIYTANLQNAAGNFINSNATYSVDSLPVPQITSANWINVTFATSSKLLVSAF